MFQGTLDLAVERIHRVGKKSLEAKLAAFFESEGGAFVPDAVGQQLDALRGRRRLIRCSLRHLDFSCRLMVGSTWDRQHGKGSDPLCAVDQHALDVRRGGRT